MFVFDVRVCVQADGLDGLKTGICCTDHVYVRVITETDTQATLAAAQMSCRYGVPTRTVVLDCTDAPTLGRGFLGHPDVDLSVLDSWKEVA